MEVWIQNEMEVSSLTMEMELTIRKLIETIGKQWELPAETEVSLLLVDDEQMRALNHQYRGNDRTTDVLSFAMNDVHEDTPVSDPGGGELLGDIVISYPMARMQAEEYGHSLERELAYLVVHGMLHLLGYDHCTDEDKSQMRRKEEEILLAFHLPRE